MDTDYKLGMKIHKLLKNNNLENAINWSMIELWHNPAHITQLTSSLADFIQGMGLNVGDKSLADTPKRVAKLFIEDLFWGLDYSKFPTVSTDENTVKYANPLISNNIKIRSTCEHHFVAINGYATIAYIPGSRLIGVGKLNQLVSFFAHRPQIQERLTRQIFCVLKYLLGIDDIAVAISARHDCIDKRQSEEDKNKILTIEMGGRYLTDNLLNSTFHNLVIHKV